jgi:hypothetical protein
MIRKIGLTAAFLAASAGLPGCFSLNMEENDRMISHWGRSLDEMRALTNKYFFDFDRDSPFED